MHHVYRKFLLMAVAAIPLCLAGMVFADDGTPGRPAASADNAGQQVTQIKPEPPLVKEERLLPGRDSKDKTLLADSPLQRFATQPKLSDFWIGVQCGDVTPPLRSHLGLGEKEGVLVEWVMPESPAEKAGVELYDVILKVNDKPVATATDIIKIVDETKGGELTVSAIRKGKPIELKITPDKRPDNAKLPAMPPRQHMFRSIEPGVIIENAEPGSQYRMPQKEMTEDMRRMLEQVQKQFEEQMKNFPESGGFRFESTPGTIGPMLNFGGVGAGMNMMQIAIEPAQGDREATLTVRKNGQTWSVSQFSDLPESVQKDVAEILENTVDGKDVADWIAEQMKSNRRMTFSVTITGNNQDAPKEEP